jgi:hypothetical protein
VNVLFVGGCLLVVGCSKQQTTTLRVRQSLMGETPKTALAHQLPTIPKPNQETSLVRRDVPSDDFAHSHP